MTTPGPRDDLDCRDDRRRRLVRADRRINGIESVEPRRSPGDGRWSLHVYFLHPIPRQEWAERPVRAENVRLSTGPNRTAALRGDPTPLPAEGRWVDGFRIGFDPPGGSPRCTLALVEAAAPEQPVETLAGFDPFYARGGFALRPDCLPPPEDPAAAAPSTVRGGGPPLDYLARDFASLRRQMLDRLTRTIPAWRDRYAADQGMAIVEAIAYLGDHLSYYQDAVATEAYLGTARKRVSVRRHARLVDYRLHEGCNARAWVQFEVDVPVTLDRIRLSNLKLTTPPLRPRANRRPLRTIDDLRDPEQADRIVFEPVLPGLPPGAFPTGGGPLPMDARFRPEHNLMTFHTWGGRLCSLPAGSTRATLRGRLPGTPATADDPNEPELDLNPGDVLIFEEVVGPRTGLAADADPSRRHAVRLTRVEADHDDLTGTNVVNIAWDQADAPPFALCVATRTAAGMRLEAVTVARGNVLLVDHGLTLRGDPLVRIDPSPDPLRAAYGSQPEEEADDCAEPPPCPMTMDAAGLARPRFQPLPRGPITHAAPFPNPADVTAAQAGRIDLWRDALRGWQSTRSRMVHEAPRAEDREAAELLARLDRLAVLSRAGLVLDTGDPVASLLTADPPDDPAALLEEVHGFLDAPPPPRGGAASAEWGPAAHAMLQDPCAAAPEVLITRHPEDPRRDGRFDWRPRPDLLASGPRDRHFVVEVDDDGRASLRFGDGGSGRDITTDLAADPPLRVIARVGNGARGNVAADTITEFISGTGPIEGVRRVRNPLPAGGGTDPEPTARARQGAPAAIRGEPRRAIVAEDYARFAQEDPDVQRAAALPRDTGAGAEILVALDLTAAAANDPARVARVREAARFRLEAVRQVGHIVSIVPAAAVPIELAISLTVASRAVRATVVEAVRRAVLKLFDPDALSFGQSIATSRIVAAARSVPDVTDARVTRLRRRGAPVTDTTRDTAPATGMLEIGDFEVARLDADPQSFEGGVLTITAQGGL